ncbi:phosphatase PAP2 family protein [Streptomyces sp. NPDC055287]
MRETPRSQGTAGGSRSRHPLPRPGRAFAHMAGASSSGTPHRSDRRPPHTPRGARQPGPGGCLGTTPPVPGQPAFLFGPFALSGLLSGLLFALVTWQVAAAGPLRRADERLGRAVVGHGPTGLTEFLADLGNMAVALPVLAAAVAYTLWCGGRGALPRASAAVLSMAAVPALVVPLKSWIARTGPLTRETGYYPSGHTATAAVAYCGAALLLLAYVRRHRWWPPAVALVLTLATGAGLVLRGYHWPLDVVGSWCLCVVLLLLSHRLPARYRRPPRASRAPAAPDR